MQDNKIPVTIITGFLGSGKTTLLNNLIKKYNNKKFAIIENEFGEIGIDGGLIVGADNNVFELKNGCICCSINEDFYKTVYQLLENTREFNHLLIETTGIADPDSIIQAFISSPKIREYFDLDSIIGIADAINLEDMIDEQFEVRKQLALSDIILLNKTDAVLPGNINKLVKIIESINPSSEIIPVAFSDITSVNILDTYSYTAKAIEKTTLSFQNLKVIQAGFDSNSSAHIHNKEHNHHIQTEGFIIADSFDYDKFILWMKVFLLLHRNRIYRVKGIISFYGKKEQFVFQAIRSEFIIEEGKQWNTDMRFSKLIFIGKKIDRDRIEDELYQLIPVPGEIKEE
jgi:G3E family GTPase